jgi:molybdopterin converting factor small subunit
MQVSIAFYSWFRDLTGCSSVTQQIEPGTTLGGLYKQLKERFPKLAAMEKPTLMAVGVEYQDAGYLLREGDEVSFFPPVQGG